MYTIHTEADDEKIVAEVYPHDDKFTHLINADLLHHAAELVAELRRMYEREDKLLGWIKGTITEAKDYVIYDEDDEMWTYNESKTQTLRLTQWISSLIYQPQISKVFDTTITQCSLKMKQTTMIQRKLG